MFDLDQACGSLPDPRHVEPLVNDWPIFPDIRSLSGERESKRDRVFDFGQENS